MIPARCAGHPAGAARWLAVPLRQVGLERKQAEIFESDAHWVEIDLF